MIDVAVVEPEYQINLGYIARIMKNFGAGSLYLINPRCDPKGSDAIKYSKHARALLEHARVRRSLAGATKGAFVIGSTGNWSKTDRSFHNIYTLGTVRNMLRHLPSSKRVVLVLGRDGTGLTKDELRECDATIFIAANRGYQVLNISHALAIMLYELTRKRSWHGVFDRVYSDSKQQKMVLTLFDRLVSKNRRIRDKRSVSMAFRHVLARSMPTKKEANAIAVALSGK